MPPSEAEGRRLRRLSQTFFTATIKPVDHPIFVITKSSSKAAKTAGHLDMFVSFIRSSACEGLQQKLVPGPDRRSKAFWQSEAESILMQPQAGRVGSWLRS